MLKSLIQKNSESTLDVAVLGVGEMGETVVQHLLADSRVGKIFVHDHSNNRMEHLAAKYGVQTRGHLADIFSNNAIKACFVTAPNHAHRELAEGALLAGKAVLCEKPIATTIEDSESLVQLSEKIGGWLQIGFELRYSKLYLKIKQWIDDGLLGSVTNTHCQYICSEFIGKGSWRNHQKTGGGMFGEKLSHYVDLPRWWIGEPVVEVYSACSPNIVPYYEARDNFNTTCRYRNGAVSHLNFQMAVAESFAGDPLQNVVDQQAEDGHSLTYLIVGTSGAASTDVFRRKIKRWKFSHEETGMKSSLVETLTWDPDEDHIYFHNTRDQTHDVVRRVLEGLPPFNSAADALETMRIVNASEASADRGKPVYLSPEDR